MDPSMPVKKLYLCPGVYLNLSLSVVLAVRRVGGCGDWWPVAREGREAVVRSLGGGWRVLERSSGEGLRQVRSSSPVHVNQMQVSALLQSVYWLLRQAERLLWGSVGRQHVWRLWGFHRRSHRDVRVKESTRRSLQHHRPRHRERIAAGLLYRRERWFSLFTLCWTQGYRWRRLKVD